MKYLDSLQPKERKRCYGSLKLLEKDPYTSRSNCDIKKIRGREKVAYRLRVGDYRFLYIIKGKEVFVKKGFMRGRGY